MHADRPWVSTLPFTPPYSWDSFRAYHARRAIPGVEAVSATSYRRSALIGGAAAIIDARPGANGLTVSCNIPCDSHVERLRRQFDLDADPAVIDSHLAADPLLAPLVARHPGLRVPRAWDPFELAVRAMVGQQVSVAGATTVTGRIAARYGVALANRMGGGELRYLFPTAARLADADTASLAMPGKRALAIIGLARAVAGGAIDLDRMGGLDEAIERLCALPGIGPWTAHYIAMRGLAMSDAFPAGDLGLQRAAAADGGRLSAAELIARAEPWRPWRAYAALHLWTSLG